MPLHVSIVSVKNYKYIRVYSSYRNEKGQPRSRLIENHGRLDTALSKDPQYVEKLKERIAKENQLEASTKAQEVEKQAKERMDKLSQAAQGLNDKPGCFKTYNVGAALIRKVWSDLKLPEMFRHLLISLKYANGLRNGANSDTHRCKQLTEHGEERCIKLREVAGFSAVRTIFQIVGPRKILHCLLGK